MAVVVASLLRARRQNGCRERCDLQGAQRPACTTGPGQVTFHEHGNPGRAHTAIFNPASGQAMAGFLPLSLSCAPNKGKPDKPPLRGREAHEKK